MNFHTVTLTRISDEAPDRASRPAAGEDTLTDAVAAGSPKGDRWRPPHSRGANQTNCQAIVSRSFDIALAASLLLFVAPLMLALAGVVFFQDGRAPVFAHRRIGKGGRPFACLKFRSMVPDAELRLTQLLATNPAARHEWERDQKLRFDPRVTRLGKFMRRSSLDELPQLINVLRGEMSLVGPRPIVEAEIPRYGRHFRRYSAMRPGLTGLWQVSGRNDVSYRRRVVMDVAYARSKSLWLDAAILAATLPVVLTRTGSA